MTDADKVARQFARKSPGNGIAVIEGNRGLFDGVDTKGSYSTAELAKLLDTPVILVVDATKVTRTAAALVLGCQKLDPELKLSGVVLNRVAGSRHQDIAARSIEEITGIPVLGAAPKLKKIQAPERHLGLVTPEETPGAEQWVFQVAREIEPYLDIPRILEIARAAGDYAARPEDERLPLDPGPRARIGVIRDSAFPFYYAENLEALERAGAELIWIRAVDDPELPELDALYIGGGFPETHGQVLSGNLRFRESLKAAVEGGLPVYAECGGAIYLGRRLYYQGVAHEMVGILPFDFEFCPRPQGHGYTLWRVDRENPFYAKGTEVRGHEFHYTRVKEFDPAKTETVAAVERGTGFDGSREGVRVKNVVAFYGHVHALGCPEWAKGLVRAGRQHAERRLGHGPQPIKRRKNITTDEYR
jgi:cobyrinic acid a,c-diamide synthase